MAYIASHQGREVRVQIQERTDGLYHLLLGDREYLVDYLEAQPNLLSLLIDGHSYEVDVNSSVPDQFDVVIEGDAYVVEVAGEQRKKLSRKLSKGATGRQDIKSPMAGSVRSVLVQPGDRVVAGQPLLILEAMKMQNEIVSPINGVVASLSAQEGVPVGSLELLCVVEPMP
jgi:biotin carboxyl carrier protein